MIRITVVLAILLSPASLLSQEQTPSDAQKACPDGCVVQVVPDPAAWTRSLEIGLSYTDGNSNTTDLHTAAAASRDYLKNIWDLTANYSFGESDSEESDKRETKKNEASAKAAYKRLLTESIFSGIGIGFEYDEVAEIDYRYLFHPAMGAFLIREDDMKWSLEAGPSYVVEQVGGVDDDYLSPRVSDSFEWKISSTAKVTQSAEVLFDVSNSDNYIINAEVGIESAMTQLLSLSIVLRNSYDNEPAPDRKRNDLALISGVKVNF